MMEGKTMYNGYLLLHTSSSVTRRMDLSRFALLQVFDSRSSLPWVRAGEIEDLGVLAIMVRLDCASVNGSVPHTVLLTSVDKSNSRSTDYCFLCGRQLFSAS